MRELELNGAPGLTPPELLGPLVRPHACGPLLTVHDALMELISSASPSTLTTP